MCLWLCWWETRLWWIDHYDSERDGIFVLCVDVLMMIDRLTPSTIGRGTHTDLQRIIPMGKVIEDSVFRDWMSTDWYLGNDHIAWLSLEVWHQVVTGVYKVNSTTPTKWEALLCWWQPHHCTIARGVFSIAIWLK